MTTSVSKAAEDLLDEIEALEVRSLTWGFADGSLSMDEAVALAAARGATAPADVVEELVAARLVFEIASAAGTIRIRSRFGETMRLLVRSRQLFDGRPWDSAPRLVSDFRVDRRRRNYPRRNRSADAVAADNSVVHGHPLRQRLWRALTANPPVQLAAFQERSLLRLLGSEGNAATIVTAGTGSGKTLAFYLPALLRVGEEVRKAQHWVKALAIYPRRELLKDQLAEAFKRCRALDVTMKHEGRRPVLLGALFSSTPRSADPQAIEQAKWPGSGKGYVCPWMNCPRCGGDLLWRSDDIATSVERLVCTGPQCGLTIDSDQLVLTRDGLVSRPADILFTTTEILNQRLSDLRMRGLFGLGVPAHRKPLFALLDEVHTYVGTSGAQAALVLRRWKHLLDAPLTWCGLSATLAEAPRFFSDLIGLPPEQVREVTPQHDEMIQEGAEYQVVVRGDTTLQASLLSTSIQAVMLIARMLDPVGGGPSGGFFGNRVFVFTDDLDVTNRLFDNLRDAEAYSIFGQPDPRRRPLAALRGNEPRDPRRDADGQRWWAAELIRMTLAQRLIIGRTTSQDAGVLKNADVIVATATLEVGYNDDQVGAVIQHKSPRNAASFLQRRGRAGRARGMRPLMLTVLSEYGRDRLAFQAYEHLFDPSLPTQYLPIRNAHILRMQATYSLLDWLAKSCAGSATSGWMWDVLSGPRVGAPARLMRSIEDQVSALTKGDARTLESLRQHLSGALQLEMHVIDTLLWDPPRSILLEVVPTLARRLFRQWKLARPASGRSLDFHVNYHPLPDFVPRNLFSDLSLPEVQVLLPPATRNAPPREDALPIVQALQQLAPGRVTRRFAFERGALCHWVPVDPKNPIQRLAIERYAEHSELVGTLTGTSSSGDIATLPVYRPWVVRLAQVSSSTALPSSNAFPVWYTGIAPLGAPLDVEVPSRTAWSEVIGGIRFYLHRFRSSVAVRRFAPMVQATVRKLTGESQITIQYEDAAGGDAAIGFEIEADGFALDFVLASPEQLASEELSTRLRASSRSAYLRYRVLANESIPSDISALQRDWLHQVWMTATLCQALQDQSTLAAAAATVLRDAPRGMFAVALRSILSVQELEARLAADNDEAPGDNDGEGEAREDHPHLSRLEQRLLSGIQHPEVRACLNGISAEFDRPDSQAYGTWLRHTLHQTLAEGTLHACLSTAPRHAALDTLVADIGVSDYGHARVWVTETTLGGAGILEAFVGAFANDPRSLFRAIEASVAPTDLELANEGLSEFVKLACDDPAIESLTARLRATEDHAEREAARRELYAALEQRGLDMSHTFSVSLNARLFRTGSGPLLDHLLRDLLAAWDALEDRMAVAIGAREFCTAALYIPGMRDRIAEVAVSAGRGRLDDVQLSQLLSSVLWPRSWEIRQRSMQSYNPYRQPRVTDPALVRALVLRDHAAEVAVDDEDWRRELQEALRIHGLACLVATEGRAPKLRKAIVEAVGCPIDVGFLQFFPVVERVERRNGSFRATLALREHV